MECMRSRKISQWYVLLCIRAKVWFRHNTNIEKGVVKWKWRNKRKAIAKNCKQKESWMDRSQCVRLMSSRDVLLPWEKTKLFTVCSLLSAAKLAFLRKFLTHTPLYEFFPDSRRNGDTQGPDSVRRRLGRHQKGSKLRWHSVNVATHSDNNQFR